jgi:Domain of unknown function (DUF4394)
MRLLPLPLPSRLHRTASALVLISLLGACSYMPQLKPWREAHPKATAEAARSEALAPSRERPELLVAVTDDNQLITFNAGSPDKVLSRVPLQGLKAGEQLQGIDFRVAKGQLFGLSTQGRLLRIDPEKGGTTPIGSPVSLPEGQSFGFDFNPTVDRIRVVNDAGTNLRLHPDTGAQIDGNPGQVGLQTDGTLAYAPGDLLAGSKPRLVAVGYTYNKANDKITTNYAIDASTGYLVVMGSIEGAATMVSPNTGLVQSVGPLQIERFDHAAFDISDVNNAAYLLTARNGSSESKLYELNLGSGQARLIGAVNSSQGIRGMAIVP